MFENPNMYSDEYHRQEDDEVDETEEQQDSPHDNLDEEVRKIAANLRRSAVNSCISDIEAESDTLLNGIWERVHSIVRKPWFREVALISAILIFKTGLFMAYREARKVNIEIVNL